MQMQINLDISPADFMLFSFRGPAARRLPRMYKVYSTAEVVLNNGKSLGSGVAGVQKFFRETFDYDLLAEAWKKWRDVTGRTYKRQYVRKARQMNQFARRKGKCGVIVCVLRSRLCMYSSV